MLLGQATGKKRAACVVRHACPNVSPVLPAIGSQFVCRGLGQGKRKRLLQCSMGSKQLQESASYLVAATHLGKDALHLLGNGTRVGDKSVNGLKRLLLEEESPSDRS